MCFNAYLSCIFLPRYFHTSSLWVKFFFCGKGPLDLFQGGLTVPTHALGCVQFPVAKQVCCGDPRLVLQNTSPHSDRPFSAGQANVFLRITAARHPHSTCAHAPCCQSFGGLYKAIQSSVYIIKSARACGEAIYYYTPPPPRSPTARVRKLFQTVSKTRSRKIPVSYTHLTLPTKRIV